MNIQEILNNDEKFRYQLLSRMQSDCKYYLGNEGKSRHPKHLWAGDEKEQIEYMKAIWDSFAENEKPEWLTYEDILEYEKQMIVKEIDTFIDFPEPTEFPYESLLGYENGFLMGKDDVDFAHYAYNNPELSYGFYDCDQDMFVFSDFEKTLKMLKEYVQNGADGTYAIISKQGTVDVNSAEYAEIKADDYDISVMEYDYFKDINEIVWSAYKVCGEVKEYFLEDLIRESYAEKIEKDISLDNLYMSSDLKDILQNRNISTVKELLNVPFSELMTMCGSNQTAQKAVKFLISKAPELPLKETLSEKIENSKSVKDKSTDNNKNIKREDFVI